MEFHDDKKNELQKKDEIITEAIDTVFQSRVPQYFKRISKPISTSLKDVQTTMTCQRKDTGLYIDIAIPESFQDGDIVVEAKSRYLHVALQGNRNTKMRSTFTSMTRTVQLPYEVREENMETSWNSRNDTSLSKK